MKVDIEEELEAIKAIYCQSGEFELLFDGIDAVIFKLTINIKSSDAALLVTFSLSNEYPESPPKISLSCTGFSHKILKQFQDCAVNSMKDHIGSPMILNIISWIENHCEEFLVLPSVTTAVKLSIEDDVNKDVMAGTVLLHIDHMRAKKKYIKTLTDWAEELNLVGKLLFYSHWIFLILQGEQQNLKKFIKLQKTTCIDVDSMGRSCKERMVSILFDEALPLSFQNFTITECKCEEEMSNILMNSNLPELLKFIKQAIHRK